MKNIRLAVFVAFTSVHLVFARIAGTKHDFQENGGGYPIAGVNEKCSVCHVPHRPALNVPLWAHNLSTVSYSLYNQNPGYTGHGNTYYPSPATFEGNPTRLCLSCHDGTIAVEGMTFLTPASSAWIMYDNGIAQPPHGGQSGYTGLMGSHPVGTNLGNLHPGNGFCGNCHSMHGGSTLIRFYKKTIQCITCHDPHMRVAGTKFLVTSNEGSYLCQICHNM